jgi:hypothetical protein
MPYEEALSGFERFEFAEAHYACPVYRKGGGGMGDSRLLDANRTLSGCPNFV